MDAEYIKVDKTPQELGTANYYWAMVTNIILLYFFNNLRFLNLTFLDGNILISCLWAINLALGFGIIGNFILLIYRNRWFHHLDQAVLRMLAVFAVYIIFTNFPFTFETVLFNQISNIALIVIMVGISIGAVMDLIKFVNALTSHE
jgi:hypothetical protein